MVIAIAQTPGERRLCTRERFYSRTGTLPGEAFKHARREQEQYEHRRGIEPHLRATTQRFDQAAEVGEANRAGGKRIHSQAPLSPFADQPEKNGEPE